jgi:hypothetical protein
MLKGRRRRLLIYPSRRDKKKPQEAQDAHVLLALLVVSDLRGRPIPRPELRHTRQFLEQLLLGFAEFLWYHDFHPDEVIASSSAAQVQALSSQTEPLPGCDSRRDAYFGLAVESRHLNIRS